MIMTFFCYFCLGKCQKSRGKFVKTFFWKTSELFRKTFRFFFFLTTLASCVLRPCPRDDLFSKSWYLASDFFDSLASNVRSSTPPLLMSLAKIFSLYIAPSSKVYIIPNISDFTRAIILTYAFYNRRAKMPTVTLIRIKEAMKTPNLAWSSVHQIFLKSRF